MKKYISIVILSCIGLLISWTSPLYAQRKPNPELQALQNSLEKAEKDRLPKTIITISDKLLDASIRYKSLSHTIRALEASLAATANIDEMDLPLFYDKLHRTDSLIYPKLSREEKVLWRIRFLSFYWDECLSYSESVQKNYRKKAGIEHAYQPFQWGRVQWEGFLKQEFAKLLSLQQVFPIVSSPWQPLDMPEWKRWIGQMPLGYLVGYFIQENLENNLFRDLVIREAQNIVFATQQQLKDSKLKMIGEVIVSSLETKYYDSRKTKGEKKLYDQIVKNKNYPLVAPWLLETAYHLDSEREYLSALDMIECASKNEYLSTNIKKRLQQLRKKILLPTVDSYSDQDFFLANPLVKNKYYFRVRNVSEVDIEVYKTNPTMVINYSTESLNNEIKGKKPIYREKLQISGADDHKAQNKFIVLPDLPVGQYIIVIGNPAKTATICSLFAKTRIMPLCLSGANYDPYHYYQQVQLLDAVTGDPIRDRLDLYDNDKNRVGETETDALGFVDSSLGGNFGVQRKSGEDKAIFRCNLIPILDTTPIDREFTRPFTLIHTDRKLYRPGDTIQFFAMSYRAGYDPKKASLSENKILSIKLMSPNGELRDSLRLTTNRDGMVSGRLLIPAQSMLGMYYIQLIGDDMQSYSGTNISVEEYKAPTFEVKMDPFPKSLDEGMLLPITGTAKTLSGQSLAGAKGECYVSIHKQIFNDDEEEPSVVVEEKFPIQIDPETGRWKGELLLEKNTIPTEEYLKTYNITITITSPQGETITQSTFFNLGNSLVSFDGFEGNSILIKETTPREDAYWKIELHKRFVGAIEMPFTYQIRDNKGNVLFHDQATSGKHIAYPKAWKEYPSGTYFLDMECTSQEGKSSKNTQKIYILSKNDRDIPCQDTVLWCTALEKEYNVANPPTVLLGSKYDDQKVFYNIKFTSRKTEKGVIVLGKKNSMTSFQLPRVPNDEGMLGAEILLYTVRDGVLYQEKKTFIPRKEPSHLNIEWKRFRDRIKTGEEEQWTLRITTPDSLPATDIPVIAWLYDASLDFLAPNSIATPMRYFQAPYSYQNVFSSISFDKDLTNEPLASFALAMASPSLYGSRSPRAKSLAMPPNTQEDAIADNNASLEKVVVTARTEQKIEKSTPVALRKDFSPTAFFRTDLRTNASGEVTWRATIPQSLTRYKLYVYAYNDKLFAEKSSKEIEVYREFSCEPSIPRFARIGDTIQISGVVRNLMSNDHKGTIRFEVFDLETEVILYLDSQPLVMTSSDRVFPFTFHYNPIEGYQRVGVRFIAETDKGSDGEQHILRQERSSIALTQSYPIALTDAGVMNFAIPEEWHGHPSAQIKLEATANPSLFVLQSLTCLESTNPIHVIALTTNLYGRVVSRYLKNLPGVKSWLQKRREALGDKANTSFLKQNTDLLFQSVDESPWTQNARDEEKTIQRLLLFMEYSEGSNHSLLQKLHNLQDISGDWSWCPGMKPSLSLTEYMISILHSIRSYPLTQEESEAIDAMLSAAWNAYTKSVLKEYKEQKSWYLSSRFLNLVYLSTLYTPLGTEFKKPEVAILYAKSLEALRKQAMKMPLHELPVAGAVLYKSGDIALAKRLATTLVEHQSHDKNGRIFFARSTSRSWYNRDMNMQLSAIQFLRLFGRTYEKEIQGMQRWIVGEKRGQQWESTMASHWAIESILSQEGALTEDQLTIEIPQEEKSPIVIKGESVSYTLTVNSVKTTELIAIKHSQKEVPVWGGVHIMAEQPYQEIKQHKNELSLEKAIFVARFEEGEQKYIPYTPNKTPLHVGDELLIQIRIKAERNLEFLVLEDTRMGCCEPIDPMSGYSWPYYMEVRDARTQFFFDSIERGERLLEYRQRVVRAGLYNQGIARIQCCYAPEFGANTQGEASIEVLP